MEIYWESSGAPELVKGYLENYLVSNLWNFMMNMLIRSNLNRVTKGIIVILSKNKFAILRIT